MDALLAVDEEVLLAGCRRRVEKVLKIKESEEVMSGRI